jgi:hypothetical protein
VTNISGYIYKGSIRTAELNKEGTVSIKYPDGKEFEGTIDVYE